MSYWGMHIGEFGYVGVCGAVKIESIQGHPSSWARCPSFLGYWKRNSWGKRESESIKGM